MLRGLCMMPRFSCHGLFAGVRRLLVMLRDAPPPRTCAVPQPGWTWSRLPGKIVSCNDPRPTAPYATPVHVCTRNTLAQASSTICGIRAIRGEILRKSCRGAQSHPTAWRAFAPQVPRLRWRDHGQPSPPGRLGHKGRRRPGETAGAAALTP